MARFFDGDSIDEFFDVGRADELRIRLALGELLEEFCE